MTNFFKIGKYSISRNSPIYIIAEIGTNHCNGNMLMIKKMIREAKKSGANAVKFQTFIAKELIDPNAKHAKRLNKILKNNLRWYDLLKSEELSFKKHIQILNYCKKIKIDFLSTPYDKESLDFLCNKMKISAIKIASADITNHPFLIECANKMIPIILSTGMSNMKDVEESIKLIKKRGNNKIILMHCTSSYPTSLDDCNLRILKTFKKKFNVILGYSDHTLSHLTPILASALGSKVYEKHFTLNKNLPGADHKTSFNPKQFKEMINEIRKSEIILGSDKKKVLQSEVDNQKKYRRSLYANKNIRKGQKISKGMLIAKRPAKGISPKFQKEIIGLTAKYNIDVNTLLNFKMLKK